MAKPVKYPAKLRAKLEKIAAKREERDDFVDIHQTFYKAFLGKNSVYGMYSGIDEVLMRITVQMTMRPEFRPRRVTFPPPWEGDTTGGVST